MNGVQVIEIALNADTVTVSFAGFGTVLRPGNLYPYAIFGDVIVESEIVPECIVRAGSFGGLMTLYEGNFIKLGQLVRRPLRDLGPAEFVSPSSRDMDLHVRVEAAAPYTVDLRLTYLFTAPNGHVSDPDLTLRAYLDARLVEVVAWAGSHRHAVLDRLARDFHRELDRRWARNMMLSKWLDYLQDMGHVIR